MGFDIGPRASARCAGRSRAGCSRSARSPRGSSSACSRRCSFFWLAPGFEHETFIFGLAHGLGYIALCLLILAAVVRREAPWPLLAATLTPAGPVGSVIGIELIERRGWGVDRRLIPYGY